ncbi:PREDICTED: serine/threonine-protein kinase STY8-like [Nelumbo nucifera]|uniref:Serine/threonine-protein kinase STY8-like n=1 Tax=Nelumbo nucifera TaxID=4432 RepID=A0A1U7YV59_NELNU|nr:PREDICTED: serine/threonine-protein kinase STY8-like [Nelumbo nucifera]
MELLEGVGESSSPQRSFGGFSGYDIRTDVFNRLMECGNEEATCNPELREQLDAHFNRLPASYALDVNMDRVEDVLIHQKLLAQAKDPERQPVFHVRFLENLRTRGVEIDDLEPSLRVDSKAPCNAKPKEDKPSHDNGTSISRNKNCQVEFEPWSKLEDLNLDVKNHVGNTENFSGRPEFTHVPIHEVIFSTVDKPKLLSQLSALLSDIGLNIREAHVFSTNDGYSLDVFVVDGWPVKDTDGLHKAMEKAIARSDGSWSGSSPSHSVIEKALANQPKSCEREIDRRFLKLGEKIASGSCGDLYHGVYSGEDVAVKVLRSEHLNEALEVEFTQEVLILR